jgi:hypothetical protein
MDRIRETLGVCPQADTLFDQARLACAPCSGGHGQRLSSSLSCSLAQLTVREHLEFYAALKRVTPEFLDSAVSAKIHEMGPCATDSFTL